VEDAVLYPLHRQLVADLGLRADGGSVLDVGCGSGRWIRYFLESFKPRRLVGIDFTRSSIDLLKQRHVSSNGTAVEFRVADIADPELELGERFDLINVANVLFHIPEHDLFMSALRNLAKLVEPTGRILTTEYLPRTTMRTNWMLVRSRYEFEAAVRSVGLRVTDIRATSVFSNDPMGLDGPDEGVRRRFNAVRSGMHSILKSNLDQQSKTFFVNFLAEIERAVLAFCRERIAHLDMPSQKLVVLAPEV
jgi:ubiquinone/menaquinone biosynthesis C-methylase UbiE